MGINEDPSQIDLDKTVDYGGLLHILLPIFNKPRALLEEIVFEFEILSLHQFPQIKFLSISVQKLNPPLGQQIGSSEVKLEKTY